MFTPTPEQTQIFSLSWLSCGASTHQWTQSELQSQIDQAYKTDNAAGNWSVVWGPSYILDGTNNAAANTMFVAQQLDASNTPQPYYVVAIAATNTQSMFDIATEDMNIVPTNWPYVTGSTAQVTTGDNIGLTNLLSMTSPEGTGVPLQQFLSQIQNQDQTTLWFTGHSLAGALSPMLMLALMDPNSTLNQNSSENVNVSKWQKVGLMSTAGPSIGYAEFVSYLNETLVTTPTNTSVTFIWNSNDVVPHAWYNPTMQAITTPTNIFNVTLKPDGCVAKAIAKAQANAEQYQYAQFEATPAFTYPLQSYGGIGIWSGEMKFIAQLEYQHIAAYPIQFGCTWFTPDDMCKEPAKAEAAVLALCSALSGKSSGTAEAVEADGSGVLADTQITEYN